MLLRFRPEVTDDLGDAIDWYNARRNGLGDEFAGEFWSGDRST